MFPVPGTMISWPSPIKTRRAERKVRFIARPNAHTKRTSNKEMRKSRERKKKLNGLSICRSINDHRNVHTLRFFCSFCSLPILLSPFVSFSFDFSSFRILITFYHLLVYCCWRYIDKHCSIYYSPYERRAGPILENQYYSHLPALDASVARSTVYLIRLSCSSHSRHSFGNP